MAGTQPTLLLLQAQQVLAGYDNHLATIISRDLEILDI